MKIYPLVFLIFLFIFQASVLCSQNSPGGIANQLELWLKADIGTLGNPVMSGWNDQSTVGNNASPAGNPCIIPNGINYNPTVDFDGAGDFFTAPADVQSNQNAAFIVAKAGASGIGGEGILSIMDNDVSTTYDGANLQSAVLFARQGGSSRIRTRIDNVNIATMNDALDEQYHIYATSMGASNVFMYQNGLLGDVQPYTAALSSEDYYIGCRYYNAAATKFLQGAIAEVIHYNFQPGAANKNLIETYLAVKYGITLSNTGGGIQGDYNATNGINLWDADNRPSYHHHVIGIGRDDIEGLNQKQSHTLDDTLRVYLSSLASDNASNTGAFSSDVSYLMIGDNRGAMCNLMVSTAEIPASCGVLSRIDREWKVRRVNMTEDFSMDMTLSSCAAISNLSAANLRLLVDDDGDFSNGGTSCHFNGDGSGVSIGIVGATVTVSNVSTTHVPNNSRRFITLASLDPFLPVDFTDFQLACDASGTKVQWATSSETDHAYFEVEHSLDAINFESIAQIDAQGNTSEGGEYNYHSVFTSSGPNYYRIKQVDMDGSFSYSDAQVVYCASNQQAISVFPNPFEKTLHIQLQELSQDPIYVRFYNALGLCVAHEMIVRSNSLLLDMEVFSNLASGMYVLELQIGENIYKEKLLKK